MLNRIVKLTFSKENIPAFLILFEEVKKNIRVRKGCNGLRLLQDKKDPRIMFTYSLWDCEEDLNAYRESELFQTTWKKTKALFDDKPEAWSTFVQDELL